MTESPVLPVAEALAQASKPGKSKPIYES